MRKACYKDLMEKYENPMEHACDIEEGQVFIANGWCKPVGMCDSAWESMSPFVMTLAYGGKDIYPLTARRLRPLRWEMNCVCYLLDRAS